MTRLPAPTRFVNEAGTAGIGHNTPPLNMEQRQARLEADLLIYCGDKRIDAALGLEELKQLGEKLHFLALKNAHLASGIRMAHLDPSLDAICVARDIVFALALAYDGVCQFSASALAAALRRNPDTVLHYLRRLVEMGIVLRIDRGRGKKPYYRPVVLPIFARQISPIWCIQTFRYGRHIGIAPPGKRLESARRHHATTQT
jgi:DNA-binding transcriptional ArsR family regulator